MKLVIYSLLVAVALLLSMPLWADKNSGDDIRVTQSNDMNNQTAGDIDIKAIQF